MTNLQLHDLFDRSFERTAGDCSDLLDWPGRTAPFTSDALDSATQRTSGTDWEKIDRLGTQIKLDVYKGELIDTNPRIAHLKDTDVVFLMRGSDHTKAMPTEEGEDILLIDALWLSFASFCIQSLFATFPSGQDEATLARKQRVSIHFAFRALLFQEILQEKQVDKPRFKTIWKTWPTEWDVDSQTMIYLWTALGRFIVAHELSHLALHQEGECRLEKVPGRGLIPRSWDIPSLVGALGEDSVKRYIFEVEADLMGMTLCDQFASGSDDLRRKVMGSVYYLFLCLCELDQRVSGRSVFEPRKFGVRAWIHQHPLGGDTMLAALDNEFVNRTKFYFDMSAILASRGNG